MVSESKTAAGQWEVGINESGVSDDDSDGDGDGSNGDDGGGVEGDGEGSAPMSRCVPASRLFAVSGLGLDLLCDVLETGRTGYCSIELLSSLLKLVFGDEVIAIAACDGDWAGS